MKYDHFIITRFGVRSDQDGGLPSDEWVEDRLKKYEYICLSSLKGQLDQNFRVLLLVDSAFDARGYKIPLPSSRYEIVVVDEWWVHLAEIIRERSAGTHVITTRLDNDDALGSEFVQRVQYEFKGQDAPTVIDLQRGVKYFQGKMGTFIYPSNMFISLINLVDRDEHCYSKQHPEMIRQFDTMSVRDSGPFWLHVVHPMSITYKSPHQNVNDGLEWLGFFDVDLTKAGVL